MFSQILSPEGHHPAKSTKADKKFSKRLDFNDIKVSSQSWRYTKDWKKFHQH